MSLNVKNEEAYRLAQAIAEATGETLTYAVTQALRERYAKLERLKGKASVDEILGIAARVSARISAPYPDHGELLYGEDGLSK